MSYINWKSKTDLYSNQTLVLAVLDQFEIVKSKLGLRFEWWAIFGPLYFGLYLELSLWFNCTYIITFCSQIWSVIICCTFLRPTYSWLRTFFCWRLPILITLKKYHKFVYTFWLCVPYQEKEDITIWRGPFWIRI